MGSSNSRPKIFQVKPSQNWFEEQSSFYEVTSNKMITAVQNTTESHHEVLRRQQFKQLPPLKQQVPHIVNSVPESQNLNTKQGQSIIRSHPPQRAKAWQPTAQTMESSVTSGTNDSMAKGWRDVVVLQHSTSNQRGHCKTGTKQQEAFKKREADSWQALSLALVLPLGLITVLLEWKVAWAAATVLPPWDPLSGYKDEDFPSGNERNMEGFLQAQTSLTAQANKKLRAHQKHFKEKQREQQTIFTFTDAGNQQTERIRLVSRPTQRDIFWDETMGQRLDLRELLQPTPELTDSDSKQEEMPKGLQPNTEAKFTSFSRNSVTTFHRGHSNPLKQTAEQKIPWLEDFRRHEKNKLG